MGVTWNLLIAVAHNNIGIFLRTGFLYHIYAIPVWAKAHCTNSEAWVVTVFLVTVIQIKIN
jgi:hypothetical protein